MTSASRSSIAGRTRFPAVLFPRMMKPPGLHPPRDFKLVHHDPRRREHPAVVDRAPAVHQHGTVTLVVLAHQQMSLRPAGAGNSSLPGIFPIVCCSSGRIWTNIDDRHHQWLRDLPPASPAPVHSACRSPATIIRRSSARAKPDSPRRRRTGSHRQSGRGQHQVRHEAFSSSSSLWDSRRRELLTGLHLPSPVKRTYDPKNHHRGKTILNPRINTPRETEAFCNDTQIRSVCLRPARRTLISSYFPDANTSEAFGLALSSTNSPGGRSRSSPCSQSPS